MVAALLGALALGACTSDDGGDPSSASDTAPEASLALAGELGPTGGVLWDGHELQGGPDELFDQQEDSARSDVFAGPSIPGGTLRRPAPIGASRAPFEGLDATPAPSRHAPSLQGSLTVR